MSEQDEVLKHMRDRHEYRMMEQESWGVRHPRALGIIIFVLGVVVLAMFSSSKTTLDAASTKQRTTGYHKAPPTGHRPY